MFQNTTTSLQTFNFEANEVRTITIQDEPWFVATDVCQVLDITETHRATSRLDEDEKGRHSMTTLGGEQEVTIINESGLYSLILTSRKPQARKFKRWVTHEVLPAIRKTGTYGVPAQPAALTPAPSVNWGRYAVLMAEMERLWCEATNNGQSTIPPREDKLQAPGLMPSNGILLLDTLWTELFHDLDRRENRRLQWRALVAMLQALDKLANSDTQNRVERMLHYRASLPELASLTHQEVEDQMVVALMRFVAHPETDPKVAQLWQDVMKLLRTGQQEGLAGKGGAR